MVQNTDKMKSYYEKSIGRREAIYYIDHKTSWGMGYKLVIPGGLTERMLIDMGWKCKGYCVLRKLN